MSVLKNLAKKVLKVCLLLGGAIAFIIFKLLKPLVTIRFGRLHCERIGHLGSNTELFLRRQLRDGKPPREVQIFISGKPCNQYLLKMIKRKITVIESPFALKICDQLRPLAQWFDVWIHMPFSTNEYDEYNNIPPQIFVMTPEDERQGGELLSTMGIKEGVEYVCFHARDKSYLESAFAHYPKGH